MISLVGAKGQQLPHVNPYLYEFTQNLIYDLQKLWTVCRVQVVGLVEVGSMESGKGLSLSLDERANLAEKTKPAIPSKFKHLGFCNTSHDGRTYLQHVLLASGLEDVALA